MVKEEEKGARGGRIEGRSRVMKAGIIREQQDELEEWTIN
jgi:hypothetical protein